MMTVQDLINALLEIEDKSMTVFAEVFCEYEDRVVNMREVHEDGMNYVVLC